MNRKKQTEYTQEFSYMVKTIISRARMQEVKLTQKEIGKSIGINTESGMSQLMNGHESVSNDHLLRLREKYKKYLPNENEGLKGDIAVLQSSMDVIIKEIAKLQKEVYKKGESKDYLSELYEEIALNEVGKLAQNE